MTLKCKDNRTGVPTSKVSQNSVDPPSEDVTHVYVKQHETRGLDPNYRGPFKVVNRPTRSTLEIRAGLNKEGVVRKEWRAWSDCKPAHMRKDAVAAERPKRGRPPKQAAEADTVVEPDQPSTSSTAPRSVRSTRNPAPNYVDALVVTPDFTKPPPPFTRYAEPRTWTALAQELASINQSITSTRLA